jgi:hypothetical protein
VVYLWADAANASAAFTARDAEGQPAPLTWGGTDASTLSDGPRRALRHTLSSDEDVLEIGWFLLGTMRQERDFQYFGWHERPYVDPPFVLRELTDLAESLERLPRAEQARHLSLLNARDLDELRSRLNPRVSLTGDDDTWSVLVEQTSLDGRNRLTLELEGDLSGSTATLADGVLSVRSRSGGGIGFDVTVTTDATPLTPLDREMIFNDAFNAFYERQRRAGGPSFQRLEREVRGLELLSSEEKLMAGLPNFATYFGRDMMMTALMLEPIVSVAVQEAVIASVLQKLDASGDVSHEEALGGQAIRENAAEYAELIRSWEEAVGNDPEAAEELLSASRALLEDLQAVRENRRMVDDDFQLSVLADRYLARRDVPTSRKLTFLNEVGSGGVRRLDALMTNLAFVADAARPFVEDPTPTNLVGFLFSDENGWLPGSWRDSREGYGRGRFAMDVNVVWVPKALEATAGILRFLGDLGFSLPEATQGISRDASALDAYVRNPARLQSDIATWRGARRHFEVVLDPGAIRSRLTTWLATLPAADRTYWERRPDTDGAVTRPLTFLALALEETGRPIPAVNTDPATELFLEDYTEQVLARTTDPVDVVRMLDIFVRPYPVGLFVDGLGPLVTNDAYASAAVQERFRNDPYHSPSVVWGREVNLLFLGLARQIRAAYDDSGVLRDSREEFRAYVDALRDTLEKTRRAVEESRLRNNELWSYRIDGEGLRPIRYGTSSDVQLWNVTDLAVRFLVEKLPAG